MNMHHDDPRVKAAFDRIVARTPEIGPAPSPELLDVADRARQRRRARLAVAASVAALGVAGLAWAATALDRPSGTASIPTVAPAPTVSPGSVPIESATSVAPQAPPSSPSTPSGSEVASEPRGGPTLFPVLDPAAVGDAPITARLNYNTGVNPQTNAVVARIEDDGSTTDFYTFVAGEGVRTYTDNMGISVDVSTPDVHDLMGYGYAAWTTDDVPVLAMAPDPAVLLDDPAFAMTVTTDERGDATLEFESLPPGFELLVEPLRFAREAAMAQLLIGDPASPDGVAGNVTASLDHPLTNLNLTEGSTITPTQVGESDAWIVSFPETDLRTVVWSPDGTTWVAVHSTGPDDHLLTLAGAVTFTDDVGEWMTRYGVELPPVYLDEPTAAG